jgi:hypothetical protein
MNETGHNITLFKCNPQSVISPNTQRSPKTRSWPVFDKKKGNLPDALKKINPHITYPFANRSASSPVSISI